MMVVLLIVSNVYWYRAYEQYKSISYNGESRKWFKKGSHIDY